MRACPMRSLTPTALIGLASVAALAVVGATCLRVPTLAAAGPVATVMPTASPTPVASGGMCTITGQQTADAARESRRRGTVIFVIGLGADAAQPPLRRLASSPEHFYYTPGVDGL